MAQPETTEIRKQEHNGTSSLPRHQDPGYWSLCLETSWIPFGPERGPHFGVPGVEGTLGKYMWRYFRRVSRGAKTRGSGPAKIGTLDPDTWSKAVLHACNLAWLLRRHALGAATVIIATYMACRAPGEQGRTCLCVCALPFLPHPPVFYLSSVAYLGSRSSTSWVSALTSSPRPRPWCPRPWAR